MRGNKRVIKETTSTVVDINGEIQETSITNVLQFPQEPPYVKLYIDDICAMNDVPDAARKLLNLLLKRLGYDGYITLSARSRKEMAAQLGWTDPTFRNQLSKLCKSGLITGHGQNEYMANPNYFGRGEWKAIIAQRKAFELTITYNAAGKTVSSRGVADTSVKKPKAGPTPDMFENEPQ